MATDEAELKEIFHHFDKDHNSRINLSEFGELLDALAPGMSDEEKSIGFRSVDTSHNGSISFQEFRDWWNDR